MAQINKLKSRGKESDRYSIELRDHNGIRRRIAGFKDKTATVRFAERLERIVEFRRAGVAPDAETARWIADLPPDLVDRLHGYGLVDASASQAARSLEEHLTDYAEHLGRKCTSSRHVKETLERTRRVLRECGFRKHSDLNSHVFERWLSTLPCGATMRNHYTRSLKSFCKWMTPDRAPTNPMQALSMKNVKLDERHTRRVLSMPEIGALIHAAENGRPYRGCTGKMRGLIYRMAAQTGLRFSEIGNLTRETIRTDLTPPQIHAKAAMTKARRADVLPIRKDLAALLQAHLDADPALPTARVFPTFPAGRCGADMMRRDLRAAGIPYKTSAGVADFHSLRHGFITHLVQSGASPDTAQRLARHASITQTMDRYNHTTLALQAERAECLPTIESAPLGTDEGEGMSAAG